MKGTEAVDIIMSLIGESPVVNANGFIGREAFRANDRQGNFYIIGSMGLASSIGLGVALCRPEKKVVVLDGDGNVLMAMGTLAMIAAAAPKNFVHVVLDNEGSDPSVLEAQLGGLEEQIHALGKFQL